MLVLALDSTALTASAACVRFGEDNVLTKYSLYTVKNELTHSENLMPMVDSVLNGMNAKIGDIGLIAVSAGPGSFTGVRIGVTTVKGLAFPGDIPCVGVSTLEAIAESLSGTGDTVCAVMDARRGQLYNALFRRGRRLCGDRAVSAEQLYSELSRMQRVIVCGDGAEVFLKSCPETGRLFRASAAACEQNALSVAEVGYRAFLAGKAVKCGALAPVYLRDSQAERERKEKLK
ncbi:MAG: tRNA (adenosine(37)-N6)-threonylcarbamoyltransferase complex dimerization subunit type 1 TsaB [Clostridiales bacterium]|nr:tRNA (adenosine(37)-N6)-threonylcarbamoyltransferase complex dimerization subunit type 1 TsaB [Clostridiales bacterium]